MLELDVKNRRILFELDRNARQPFSMIGKRTGLSKEVVNYRIKSMESKGLIRSYYALVDLSKIGLLHIRYYIKLMDMSPEEEEGMIVFLKNDEKLCFLSKIDGIYDFGLLYVVSGINEAEVCIQEFRRQYNRYIRDEQICVFTQLLYLGRRYLWPGSRCTPRHMISGSPPVTYDHLDMEILRALSRDCRKDAVSLASELNTTSETVLRRIKSIQARGIISGYRIYMDNELLGYFTYKIDLNLSSYSEYEKIIAYIRENDSVTYLDYAFSGWNIEFDIEIKNKNECNEIIRRLRLRFASIRSYRYYSYRSLKEIYAPCVG